MTLLHHMRLKEDLKLAEYFAGGGKFEFEGRSYEGAKDASGKFIDAWPEGMDDRAKTALSYLRYMQDYLACVQSVDDSVGDMCDYLAKKGILDSTVVIYTSDQGFFLGDHGLYDKRFIMDEVARMPFLARCPAIIAPGSVNSDIVTNIDFSPTFLDIADEPRPGRMQGESFLGNLKGQTPGSWREDCYMRYYVEGGEHSTSAWYGIRTKTDALVYYYKRNEWEYFDIVKDPDEVKNEYANPAYQERINFLKKRITELKQKLGDDDKYANAKEYGTPEP